MTRAATFWNDQTISLIKKHFVAASVPTWLCRSDSPEGEFLRGAGIDKQWVTSSGYMSCISASGKMLGYRPGEKVLEAFEALPESERKPGAVSVPALNAEQVVIPSPPKGGIVLRVHARFLARDKTGQLRHVKVADFPLMRSDVGFLRTWNSFLQPNTEYLWLTRDEWQTLVPDQPRVGNQSPVNETITERIARFHLSPQRASTSEGGVKSRKSIKKAALTVTVTDISPQQLRMELAGVVHWGSDFDAAKATTPNGPLGQGFETQLFGQLVFDRTTKTFTRFDIVAPGDIWGRWGDANGKSMYVERPGRNPFGFAFELATGDSPTDRIPPGGNSAFVDRAGYFPKP